MARSAAKKQKELSQEMIREGRRLSEQYERPEFEIPTAVEQQMRGLQGRQYQQLPGYQMAQNQMQQSLAQGTRAAERMGTGSEAFGALAGMYGQNLQQQRTLQQQQAAYQDRAQMDYLSGLGQLGNWQHQGWQWDVANPYLQAQQKAAQLEMMGRQGEYAGIGAMGGAMSSAITGGGQGVTNILAGLGEAGVFGGGGNQQPSQASMQNMFGQPKTWQDLQGSQAAPVQGPTKPTMDFDLIFK